MIYEGLLGERDFSVSHKEVTYEITARAVFCGIDPDVGSIDYNFMSNGKHVFYCQSDTTLYTRKEAEKAAIFAFDSGQVERYLWSQIQTWINIGFL